MAVSAAEYYEVRWRVKGNNEAWSSPRRVSPVSEVVIEELDRNTLYEFEVRAVSNCGAKSIWVPSDYTVPGAVPPTSVDTLTAQSLADGVHLGWTSIATPAAGIESSIERSPDGTTGWAERARVRSTAYTDPETSGTTYYYRVRYVNFAGQFGAYSPVASSNGVNVGTIGTNASNALADAIAAQSSADAANAALADIASDNLLTAGEKPTVIRDWNVIAAEQAGIDAQATAYGITTEKTNYDNAVTALASYLGTLTAPKMWNDLSGNTTIVGATFRSNFASVYTTRQTLLNAIYAAAKARADAAQGTANTANTTASNAASTKPVINPQFLDGLNTGWTYDNAAGFYVITNADTPDSAQQCHLARNGQPGVPTTAARNLGYVAVQVGQTVIANCCIKAFSCNAGSVAQVRISWRDVNHTELSVTLANVTCGPGGTYLQCVSKAAWQAPANSQFAHLELYFTNHTSGYFTATSANLAVLPSSIDEVPDGTTNARTLATRVSAGNPLIDFSAGYHLNKNIGNIADGGGYMRGVQSSTAETVDNADFEASAVLPVPGWTAENANLSYATTTNAFAGTQSLLSTTTVQYGAAVSNRMYPCKPGDQFLISAAMTNVINSGPASVIAMFIDKTGATVGNGGPVTSAFGWAVYSAVATAPAAAVAFVLRLQNNGVAGSQAWFDQIRLSRIRSLDTEIADGTSYGRTVQSRLSSGVPLIDFGAGIHLNKNVDNIGDGTAYGRFKMASMTGNDFDFSKGGVNKTLDYVGDTATYGRVSTTDLSSNRIGLRVAGSGQVLGNQLNAPNSLTLNYGAARTATAVTATSAGAVSINAFSVNMGGNTISYNAVSNAVTGLTQGTTYQIYCHDLGGTGGTKTWYAIAGTANAALQQGDDVVLGGQVTIPTSGSSGGGGGGFCVTADMFVADGELAGEPVPGALYDCMDIPTRGMSEFQRPLYGMEISSQPCVRIVTVDGAELDCSASTPFDLLDGRAARAADMKGETVVTDLGVEVVASVTPIGIRSVCHRHHGGCSFAAGRNPKHRIYSHNALKP